MEIPLLANFAHLAPLASFAPLFPYDPAIEKPLAHQHLAVAYCFCWGIQLVYLGYVLLKRRAASRAERE